MQTKKVNINIIPRKPFREFIQTTKRWLTLVVHRRGGKTVAAVQRLIICAMSHKRKGMKTAPLRYAYLAPTRDQAKDITWTYLKDFTAGIPGMVVNESELKITFPNKAQIRLYSGENYERMRGLYFDGVVSDEDDDIPHGAFTYVILPCLIDYQGWHCRMGTPKGKGSLYGAITDGANDPKHFTLLLKASESGLIDQDTLDAMRKKIGDDAYAQEMECDFNVARPGAIYGDLISQMRTSSPSRICDFPIDKAPVFTFWDLGISDSTSIWFAQFVGQEIRMIDWYENTGEPLSHYGEYVKNWSIENNHSVDLNYLPHDGNARQLATGKTLADSLREMGMRVEVVNRTPDIWLAIDKLREILPRMWFREAQCNKRWNDGTRSRMSGIECLEAYRVKPDEPGKVVARKPLHDDASHTSDAARTLSEAILQNKVSNRVYSEKEARNASPIIMGSRGRSKTRY
jgi:phage terminase large subunit